MSIDLKKRIGTSITLFFLLFLMLINNLVLGYFIIVIGIISILEFFKIILIIYKNDKIKQLIINLLFIIYIFLFCAAFLIFSSFLHLKILIFSILLTCVASDLGGFLFGTIFKGPKLTKISPKKTISGSIGSFLLSTIIFSILIYYLTKNFDFLMIIIALITSLGCQLGDLFFSYLKRKSLLKDTGNLLPGHGGVIDRVDGILLGMPTGLSALLLFY